MEKHTIIIVYLLINCFNTNSANAMLTILDKSIQVDFIPYNELFSWEKQQEYIINNCIAVDNYSFDIYYDYTMQERQQIYQITKKLLPWLYTLKQEQWERTMYMYQFVVKSYPFPIPGYKPIPTLIPTPSGIILVIIGIGTLLVKRKF